MPRGRGRSRTATLLGRGRRWWCWGGVQTTGGSVAHLGRFSWRSARADHWIALIGPGPWHRAAPSGIFVRRRPPTHRATDSRRQHTHDRRSAIRDACADCRRPTWPPSLPPRPPLSAVVVMPLRVPGAAAGLLVGLVACALPLVRAGAPTAFRTADDPEPTEPSEGWYWGSIDANIDWSDQAPEHTVDTARAPTATRDTRAGHARRSIHLLCLTGRVCVVSPGVC